MYKRILNLDNEYNDSVFVWGARQVGKTTLLEDLFPRCRRYDLLKAKDYNRLLRRPELLSEELDGPAPDTTISLLRCNDEPQKTAMFIVLVDVLMKTFFEEACHGCSDFRWRVADHLLKEDFHGEETAEECECAPQPLDTVVGDVSVHDHNGPNAISTHQHRRPPTGRYPAQLEQEDAHIVHKALEDAEYQHSECQPQLVGPDECRRESQRDVQCLCNMRYAWYQRAVVNAH